MPRDSPAAPWCLCGTRVRPRCGPDVLRLLGNRFAARLRHALTGSVFELTDSDAGAALQLRVVQQHVREVERRFALNSNPFNAEQARDMGLVSEIHEQDEIGAALEAGKTYTLAANANWRDAERVPLKRGFQKTFKVTPEDRTAIDPAKWKLTVPGAATRDALIIAFGESLDAALALRLITVDVPGQAQLGLAEREWRYVPDQPWKAVAIDIAIDTALEDLAGNKVGRPFDVDTFDRITVRSGRGLVRLRVVPSAFSELP